MRDRERVQQQMTQQQRDHIKYEVLPELAHFAAAAKESHRAASGCSPEYAQFALMIPLTRTLRAV